MAIKINVQDEQVTVNVVKGEINTGKPPVLQEISVTKDGTYTPDYGVDGFSKVDVFVLPTDMLDGLEDGWDVMFYDEHKRGLASYSIKQGHTINPPVYNCKAWQLADGASIEFPYTPTGDVIFYALISTYADQLYEYYGIDKGVYPYLAISINRTYYFTVAFGKSISDSDYTMLNDVYTAYVKLTSDVVATLTSAELITLKAMEVIAKDALSSASLSSFPDRTDAILALNYNPGVQNAPLYRLDE